MSTIVQVDNNTPVYSISAAAKLVGISVHTMRMYEKEGLIIPFKPEGRNRLYSYNDVERLKCMRIHIKEKKISINAIKTIYSFLPCWKIIDCPEKDREKCEAYTGSDLPCWMYNQKNSFCKDLDCRTCEVYLNFKNCDQIKEEINKHLRRL
ncbi:MAG: MerR family transcriptional regulator [Chlorobi bacterium]|nr:MerR family transcriptional regulator [Chlorobiota bacterium]